VPSISHSLVFPFLHSYYNNVCAGIAQLVEQLICNQKVPSSTLGVGTIKFNELGITSCSFFLLGLHRGYIRLDIKPSLSVRI
jgi:hypothetical protein